MKFCDDRQIMMYPRYCSKVPAEQTKNPLGPICGLRSEKKDTKYRHLSADVHSDADTFCVTENRTTSISVSPRTGETSFEMRQNHEIKSQEY